MFLRKFLILRKFLNGKSDKLCLLNHASKMNRKGSGSHFYFIIIVNSSVFDSITKNICFGFFISHFKIRDFKKSEILKSRILLENFARNLRFITIYSLHNPKPSFLHSHTPSRLFFVLSKIGNNQKKLVR